MSIRDVDVIISRQTMAVSQRGFGLPLILATSKDLQYTLYREIADVAEDFDVTSEEYKLASRLLGQTPKPTEIAIAGIEYGGADPAELVAALNTIAAQNSDFYFLLCPEQGDDEILALSGWIDTQEKLYFFATDNISILSQLESERTIPMLHKQPKTYPDAGWVGKCAPELPGSITWKFKNINGITESGFSNTEINQIVEAGGNVYIRQGGVLMTTEGQVSNGEFIDTIRGQDFIKVRMQENVFGVLLRNAKVAYTNKGIGLIIAAVDETLKIAYKQGIIADDDDENPLYSIQAPTRGETSQNDRASRVLKDIFWTAELAGAIHKTEIRGTLVV